jgi:AcrR family transcriptional regulator
MITEELTPRQRRAMNTRQSILDAAREIISERGVYGLSLREVARRIDYSPAIVRIFRQ